MPQEQNDGFYKAYWPRSQRQVTAKSLAARLDSLRGKTVAQLWGFNFRGDEVFKLLEEGLAQRYPEVRFVGWNEFGNTHGSEEREVLAALPKRLKQLGVDAAISGMGC